MILAVMNCVQANWDQVIVWLNYKPVDVEIDNDNNLLYTGKYSNEEHTWHEGSAEN